MGARSTAAVRVGALVLAGCFMLALWPLPVADSSFNGAWDKRALGGCLCHSGAASPQVVFEVEGVPESYALGASYSLRVYLVSTSVVSSGPSVAGFNAEVNQGTFTVGESWQEYVHAFDNQASHTFNGSKRTDWVFNWVAPSRPSGVAVFWFFVNTVNGDGVASPNDLWATRTLTSQGASPDTSGPAGLFLPDADHAWPPGLVGLLAAAGALGAFTVVRRKRARHPHHLGKLARRKVAAKRRASQAQKRRRAGRAPRHGR